MVGIRPSCVVRLSRSFATSLGLLRTGLRFMPGRGWEILRPLGERTFCGGSKPNPASKAPHSSSWDSILALISRAWSAMRRVLLSSRSLSSRATWLWRARLSESRRAHSFSRFRMRSDWVELTRAMSLFWRKNLRRTVGTQRRSLVSPAWPWEHPREAGQARTRFDAICWYGRFVESCHCA